MSFDGPFGTQPCASGDRRSPRPERRAAETLLSTRGWLSDQPESFRRAVLDRTSLVRFETGEALFRAGEVQGGAFGIVGGGVATYVVHEQLGTRLGGIVRAGTWCGYGPVLDRRRPRALSARASEPTVALFLPLAAIDEIVRADPEAERRFAALAIVGEQLLLAALSELLIRANDRRIAAVLLRVTAGSDEPLACPPDGFRLTQSDLGEMTACSRNLVNRTLAAFAARGWITVGYNRVVINDAAALRAFAYAPEE